MQRITLGEYQSVLVTLSADDARTLTEAAGSALAVTVGPQPDAWVLTAGSHVGTIVTPEVELLIRPKASLHNVFQMLDVTPEAFGADDFGFEADRSLLAVIAHLFGRTVERTVGSGLLRSYRPEHDRLFSIRGRIDIADTIRRPGLPIPVPCSFDEYTADVPENRALKAALRRVLVVPGVRPDTRRILSLALARFEEVADVPVDPHAIGRIVYTRLNRHYRQPLSLASLILRNLMFIDRLGSADASSFIINMNDLFQDWATERLRRHLRGRLTVTDEPTVHLGRGGKVSMAPDLLFERGDEVAYVADLKYKLTWSGIGRSSDYYQLLAYTTALDLPEGLLIYCQADGSAPDQAVSVHNTDKLLRTHAVDLSGTPAEAEASIANLANLIWTRSQQMAAAPTSPTHHAAS